MTEQELIEHIAGLSHVTRITAEAASDAPKVAWGDSFFYYEPEGPPDRKLPFATIVTKDYLGWDTLSNLDRPDAFRINLDIGADRFRELFGYSPSEHPQHADDFDYSRSDVLLPHPTYAQQGWASIVCPGPETDDIARSLVSEAHERVVQRWSRRHG